MSAGTDDFVIIGRFSAVYGIKGWLKVYSYTDPIDRFFEYREYRVQRQGEWRPIEIAEGRQHGKGLVARVRGIDDRDLAAALVGCEIGVAASELPALPENEYYWRQLEGLRVLVNHPERGELVLGRVDHLLETGANDVLVVKGDEHSIDLRERLIPYIDQVVLAVDLAAQTLRVEWDPDF